jgi:uncharacterized protein (DUF885 family)
LVYLPAPQFKNAPMKKLIFVLVASVTIYACSNSTTPAADVKKEDNKELAKLFDNYYEQRLTYFPLDATSVGDLRYNDKLFADFTDSFRSTLKTFWSNNLDLLSKFNRDSLSENDKISYDIFKREMEMSIEGLKFHDNYIPTQQFWGTPITMGQLGSGEGNQPFKTVKDYDDWIARAKQFDVWTDSAIVYFRKGIDSSFVLPKALVEKMIPQMNDIQSADATKSLFYGPITKMPATFSAADKDRLTKAYVDIIENHLNPSYKKLGTFLKDEYLPKARTTSGINALPNGAAYYNFLIRYWTTTDKTPDEIYNTGLSEVARITAEMEKTKASVNYTGDLKSFFEFLKTDPKMMPYKTPQEVLDAFANIQKKIDPKLKTMFGRTPKTKFEIRQTEAFRAASASAEYNQGSADGTRPGIFYIPIIDATKFNITSGMESLFLHEAIPGHHYQMSLQQENESLPKFRRFLWYGAYGEGWALYCESLGKELGCYTDPYQYMGALGDEMHRAVRLVVDVAIHTGKMTREEAIKYMTDHEAISTEGATAEIERYMAIPGQALSYKIGALKIRELRSKYEKDLGDKFVLAHFHDELLRDGVMPLDVLERKMDAWELKEKSSESGVVSSEK